jgi:hypothetical protein
MTVLGPLAIIVVPVEAVSVGALAAAIGVCGLLIARRRVGV